jgi:GMP synthase PP-ATPase subunit
LKLIEPLRELFKGFDIPTISFQINNPSFLDEVRALGRLLGLPDSLISRENLSHPSHLSQPHLISLLILQVILFQVQV